MGEAADFFVSYTSTDRTWAEWIAWQLEAEGNQVVSRSSLGLHPRRDWHTRCSRPSLPAQRAVIVPMTCGIPSRLAGGRGHSLAGH
jgi:TIR domain